MGHALLKKAILLLKMAKVPFDLLIAVYRALNAQNGPKFSSISSSQNFKTPNFEVVA